MRIIVLSLLLVWLAALVAPGEASAQQMNNGLSYTTLGSGKDESQGHMNYRAFTYDEGDKPAAPDDGKKTAEEKESDRVWDKYKALAAGTYDGGGDKDDDDKDDAKDSDADGKSAQDNSLQPTPPDSDGSAQVPASAGGFSSIIDEYQRNKAQRSQMHTITVSPPETPGTPHKPDVPKPAAPQLETR